MAWWWRLGPRTRLGLRRLMGGAILLAGVGLFLLMVPHWLWLSLLGLGMMALGWSLLTLH